MVQHLQLTVRGTCCCAENTDAKPWAQCCSRWRGVWCQTARWARRQAVSRARASCTAPGRQTPVSGTPCHVWRGLSSSSSCASDATRTRARHRTFGRGHACRTPRTRAWARRTIRRKSPRPAGACDRRSNVVRALDVVKHELEQTRVARRATRRVSEAQPRVLHSAQTA